MPRPAASVFLRRPSLPARPGIPRETRGVAPALGESPLSQRTDPRSPRLASGHHRIRRDRGILTRRGASPRVSTGIPCLDAWIPGLGGDPLSRRGPGSRRTAFWPRRDPSSRRSRRLHVSVARRIRRDRGFFARRGASPPVSPGIPCLGERVPGLGEDPLSGRAKSSARLHPALGERPLASACTPSSRRAPLVWAGHAGLGGNRRVKGPRRSRRGQTRTSASADPGCDASPASLAPERRGERRPVGPSPVASPAVGRRREGAPVRTDGNVTTMR